MSLASILSIARSALLTHQKAIGVVSHNLANVATEGYSRQRLDLRAAVPLRLPGGQYIGRGVDGSTIERVRSRFLDQAYRTEFSRQSAFDATGETLRRIESAMGELGETGVSAGLDEFLNAWGELAGDPSSPAARSLVRQSGAALAGRLNDLDARLAAERDDAYARLQNGVTTANQILQELADLNRQLVAAGPTGSAPDVADRRDLLLDRLSQFGDVRALPQPDGSVNVILGDVLVADAAFAVTLEVMPEGSGLGVGLAGAAGPFRARSGEFQALADLTQRTLPGLTQQLDDFVAALVTEVNARHAGGTTNGGATGVDFFDASGATASTIRLDAAITASLDSVVTGTTAAAGDNAVARGLAALRTAGVASLGGRSLVAGYGQIVSDLGIAVRGAVNGAEAQATLASNLAAQRSAVSGVSTDEELVQLMQAQQAFGAAAKVVTTADEMMQTILQMV